MILFQDKSVFKADQIFIGIINSIADNLRNSS